MKSTPEFRADQCWKTQAGDAWVRFEAELDKQLEPLGRGVLERLAPRPGERALDIGCGSGQTLLELAELVGENGHVLGVDISEPMVARARQRVAQAGFKQVAVEIGDAQTHRFDPTFDLQFSRVGVMFFQDSLLAFKNLLAALKPGGRLGFVCFQEREKNEWAEVVLSAVTPVLGLRELPPLYDPDRPGPFYFAQPDRIRSVLEGAGYAEVVIEAEQRKLHYGGASTLEQALDYAMQIGPAARAIAEADPALAPACREALGRALAPHAGPDGVWLGSAHFYVRAVHAP